MLKYLVEDPPYYSVFGFTRYDNREAREFYRRMGFNLSYFAGVYADRKSILFHASFEELRIHHGV